MPATKPHGPLTATHKRFKYKAAIKDGQVVPTSKRPYPLQLEATRLVLNSRLRSGRITEQAADKTWRDLRETARRWIDLANPHIDDVEAITTHVSNSYPEPDAVIINAIISTDTLRTVDPADLTASPNGKVRRWVCANVTDINILYETVATRHPLLPPRDLFQTDMEALFALERFGSNERFADVDDPIYNNPLFKIHRSALRALRGSRVDRLVRMFPTCRIRFRDGSTYCTHEASLLR